MCDENGKVLSGVSVTLKGVRASTSTAENGTCKMSDPSSKSVLLFTSSENLNAKISVANRQLANVSLSISQKLLEHLAVIGYGTQKKKRNGSRIFIGCEKTRRSSR